MLVVCEGTGVKGLCVAVIVRVLTEVPAGWRQSSDERVRECFNVYDFNRLLPSTLFSVPCVVNFRFACFAR